MSTWTKNQKLRGIRQKKPGAKGVLKKKWMMNLFFSKIRVKITLLNLLVFLSFECGKTVIDLQIF